MGPVAGERFPSSIYHGLGLLLASSQNVFILPFKIILQEIITYENWKGSQNGSTNLENCGLAIFANNFNDCTFNKNM